MLYGNLRWPEIQAAQKDQLVVICPIASLEQHGHHLPLLTDTYLVTAVAERVHGRLGEQVLLLPTLWLGASDHHLDFPGTVSASNTLLGEMVNSVAVSLVSAGFRKILFLNGHGGNVAPGSSAITELACQSDDCNEAYIALGSYWAIAEKVMKPEQHGIEQPALWHACEYETSMMLHLHGELVDMARAKGTDVQQHDQTGGVAVAGRFNMKSESGALGFPENATAAKGASLLAAIVDEVTAFVAQMSAWPPREPLGPA